MKVEIDFKFIVIRGTGLPDFEGKWYDTQTLSLNGQELEPRFAGYPLRATGQVEVRDDGAVAAVFAPPRDYVPGTFRSS